MKRHLLLLILLGSLLARAGQPVTEAGTPAVQNEFLHQGLTSTESEANLATPVIVASHPHFKKTVALTAVTVVLAQRYIHFALPAQPVESVAFSKSYLLHIYPSLHFW